MAANAANDSDLPLDKRPDWPTGRPHKPRAAIYCRVSTAEQADSGTSLDTQETACRERATHEQWQIATERIFREEYTGGELERPRLNRLRELVRGRQIDVILCYAVDRLSREPLHGMLLLDECEKHGVRLVFVTEDFDSSPTGKLIQYVRGWAAQLEREKIRERTMRGKRANATAGRVVSPGRWTLYGYTYDKAASCYRIDPLTAPIVKRIFALYAAGQSLREIRTLLMSEGIPSPSGTATWHISALSNLMNHAEYCGDLVYNRREAKYVTRTAEERAYRRHTEGELGVTPLRKQVVTARPESEWIVTLNAIPPLVTREEFARIQERKRENERFAVRNTKHSYPLKMMIRCEECGRVFCGKFRERHEANGTVRVERFYKANCADRARCGSRQFGAAVIEQQVWQLLVASFAPEHLAQLRLAQLDGSEAVDNWRTQRVAVTRTMERLTKEQQRLVRLHTTGDADLDDEGTLELFRAEMRRIEGERKRARVQLDAIIEQEARGNDLRNHQERLLACADEYREGLRRATPADWERIFRHFQIQITVPAHSRLRHVTSVLPLSGEEDDIASTTSRHCERNNSVLWLTETLAAD